ncbi:hypothetical protein BJ741DRAFT_672808, partial [Chytriomyces cf. hyalinus JEL632]
MAPKRVDSGVKHQSPEIVAKPVHFFKRRRRRPTHVTVRRSSHATTDATVRRLLSLKDRPDRLHAKRTTRKNGACHVYTSSTYIPFTAGRSNDLINRVPASISSSFTTPLSSTQEPTVPSTLAPTTAQTVTQVALAAEAHPGPISRRVLVAGAQSVATPIITTSTSATQSSPVLVTPTRLSQVASTQSNNPSPPGRACITAMSSPTHATPPPAATPATPKTPSSKSTPTDATLAAAALIDTSESNTTPVQAIVAAEARGLISRVSAAMGSSTPCGLPRAVSA